jgi:hypothetical protein
MPTHICPSSNPARHPRGNDACDTKSNHHASKSASLSRSLPTEMEHKFRHEDHNRQDKARKSAYREDFIAESLLKASPAHLNAYKKILALGKPLVEDSEIRAYKEQVMLRYYDGVFCLGRLDFRFRWNLSEYIRRNGLQQAFSRTCANHKKTAVQDFKAIEQSISKARATWGISKKYKQQPQFTFSVRLGCDRVVPYQMDGEDIEVQILLKRSA